MCPSLQLLRFQVQFDSSWSQSTAESYAKYNFNFSNIQVHSEKKKNRNYKSYLSFGSELAAVRKVFNAHAVEILFRSRNRRFTSRHMTLNKDPEHQYMWCTHQRSESVAKEFCYLLENRYVRQWTEGKSSMPASIETHAEWSMKVIWLDGALPVT